MKELQLLNNTKHSLGKPAIVLRDMWRGLELAKQYSNWSEIWLSKFEKLIDLENDLSQTKVPITYFQRPNYTRKTIQKKQDKLIIGNNMKSLTHPTQAQCNEIYGDPRGHNDHSNPVWESDNLVFIKTPYKMKMGDIVITRIKVHKLVAESLLKVLNTIWEGSNKNMDTIRSEHADLFSGTFNYRNKRGRLTLSMHAYGVAIDLDAVNNQRGVSNGFFKDGSLVVRAFESEGWTWGGRWSGFDYDPMHFQYPRIK